MESHSHFIAGWGAGVFGVLIGHPMDTIKTHQQMSNIKLSSREVIIDIIKKDGIRGLYKGMLFPLLSSGSLNSVYFGVYDASMKFFQSLRGNSKIVPTNTGWIEDLFIAGCLGGAAQALITCPSELIKIRMQLDKGATNNGKTVKYLTKRLSTYRTVMDIYEKYGIRSFFLGFIPTMWRFYAFIINIMRVITSIKIHLKKDGLGGGLYILSYQFTRHYMYGELNLTPGTLETMVAGGVAGFASWVPVIPFDTIKSRMQADDYRNRVHKGMVDCSIDLFMKTTYRGFFKGFFMITFRSVPVNISIIYGYEFILWILKKFN